MGRFELLQPAHQLVELAVQRDQERIDLLIDRRGREVAVGDARELMTEGIERPDDAPARDG